MKISRTLPIDEARIEVTFSYEGPEPANYNPYGDWQGEETGAVMTCGPMRIHFQFMVMAAPRPVAEWPLEEIELYHGTDFITGRKAVNTFLADVPMICEAVEIAWIQVQALETIQGAQENVWAAEADLADLLYGEKRTRVEELLAAARDRVLGYQAEQARLQRAYDETYPEETPAS